MTTKRPNHSGDPARRAFTLVELLAVMGIMAILLAVTVPSIAGINESLNISQGGQLFADQVALARQNASARNITIEVRCINVPHRSADGTVIPPIVYGYSAIQLWTLSNGTFVPVSRVQNLPDGIVISDKNALSSLFNVYNSPQDANHDPTGLMPAGGPLAKDTYVSFTINPSGMMGVLPTSGPSAGTPPNMTDVSVTVVPARHATDATLPSNYMIIQLNPLTAATLAYRP